MFKYGLFIAVCLMVVVAQGSTIIPLVNGGFEDNSVVYPNGATGWDMISYVGSSPDTGVYDISSAASWENPAPDGTSMVCRMADTGLVMDQVVSHDWVVGGEYTITFDFLSRSSLWTNFSVLLGSRLDGSSTTVLKSQSYANADVPEYSWQSYTINYTADESVSDQNQLLIRFSFAGGGGTADLDNVQISYVPEPATMCLLAVGGIATIIRRRQK